jgi:glycyl-tRNA synthetase beta chain
VSLADKLDSVAGMFVAGERPTGSRDPLGLRRQAQGAVKILTDLTELIGSAPAVKVSALLEQAASPWTLDNDARQALFAFVRERVVYLFEQRGFDVRNIRAVLHAWPDVDLVETRQKLDALAQMSG